MSKSLVEHLTDYGNQLLNGEVNAPPIELQLKLKNTSSKELLEVSKGTLTYKELKFYKENLESIPVDIKAYRNSLTDFILLTAIFTLKYLGGLYVQKIDLMIKLLAKPYNVQDQMFKTQVNM